MALRKHTKPVVDAPGMLEITNLDAFLADLRAAIGPTLDKHAEIWEREGPAIMRHAAKLGIVFDGIGGNCPVQAEGAFDGKRFYFRARGEEWEFHVAGADEAIFGPDEWYIERDYGDGPFDAGWMHKHEAVGFVCEAVAEYRAAIAAGTQRAETGATPAPSEGCQSGGDSRIAQHGPGG